MCRIPKSRIPCHLRHPGGGQLILKWREQGRWKQRKYSSWLFTRGTILRSRASSVRTAFIISWKRTGINCGSGWFAPGRRRTGLRSAACGEFRSNMPAVCSSFYTRMRCLWSRRPKSSNAVFVSFSRGLISIRSVRPTMSSSRVKPISARYSRTSCARKRK